MGDHSEELAQFISITGADEATALNILQATGFQVDQAIELFFAADHGGGGGFGSGGGFGGGNSGFGGGGLGAAMMDDEELARQLQREADAGPAEEQVRAPIPVRTERLYGDIPHRPPIPQRRVDPVPHNVVDAFRDIGGEGGAAGGESLASMFEPPRELLFVGSFEEAKQAALDKSRWLVVNVQSANQFASHQLNRDTWRNDMVQSLVQNNFVFFQVYDMVEEAQKLLHFYKIVELPATLVVDPVTGAPMRQWSGFVNAERMAEELMPFLDHDIHDPAASRLAAGLKRKKSSKGDMLRQGSAPMNEDEELQRALEMSLREGGAGASGSGEGPTLPEERTLSDEEDELAVLAALQAQQAEQVQQAQQAQRPSAAEVAAAAGSRLPPEPEGADGCRIAVRFPDGKRGQRRFPRSAPLSAVHDYCLTQVEEAAGGRLFSLSQGFPGAPVLSELHQTLEEAKVADAMLVMKWAD